VPTASYYGQKGVAPGVHGLAQGPPPTSAAQNPDILQQFLEVQVSNPGKPQSSLLKHTQDTFAIAFLGATRDATTGRAITEARPIFLITSRLLWPENFELVLPSRRLFSFSWSIASQMISSETLFPDCFSRILAISRTDVLPSHDFHTVAAVKFKQWALLLLRSKIKTSSGTS